MGAELIFAGDLNGDLERTGGVETATVGIQDISAHYLPIWRAWNWYHTTRVISRITYVAGYASLFVCPDVRRGQRRTIFLRSLGALSQSKTNLRASQLVDFWVNVENCVWLFTCHPWDLNLPFSSIHQQSYQKKIRVINHCFYQVNQKRTKIRQDTRYQI